MLQTKPAIQIRGEFCIETRPAPCALIIFGASGDLTRRKLLPALFSLYRRKLLSKNFYILGCARSPLDDDSFREQSREPLIEADKPAGIEGVDEFLALCHYRAIDYGRGQDYQAIARHLKEWDEQKGTGGHHLFYLATPPNLYETIPGQLNQAGLIEPVGGPRWSRVVVEKPQGRDLASALELDRGLHRELHEDQIYRIDHYLGKETVQNILMFRFANAIFEPIWNRRYIDHVQIAVGERLGVENRAGYFEQAGVLRDMFQNHMLQMLTLVAMEPPASFEANRVRDEKTKLLRSIRPFTAESLNETVVRGQYGAGIMDGRPAPGYRQEKDVDPQSRVETFMAARLMVDNWRWQGVPFYLRTGKRLAKKISQIAITFKRVPHSMFSPISPEELTPNVLFLNVQPDEGVLLRIQAKHPGPKLCMSSLTMDFQYEEVFEETPPDAYERLLLDCMHGDQTLFVRQDAMEVAWSLMTPILEAWGDPQQNGPLQEYAPGSWGPPAADALIRQDGREWLKL